MSAGTTISELIPGSEGMFATFQAAGIWSTRDNVVKNNSSPTKPARKRETPKVLRRLKGFVVCFEGEWAKVVYVQDNVPYEYNVQAKQLLKSGIKVENQPFEMDEVEVTIDHELVLGTVFRPLALAESARIEPLPLSEQEKLDRAEILGYFADAKT